MSGDVSQFDRFARVYDLFRRGPDQAQIDQGFELSRRPIDRVLDVGGGPGQTLQAVDGTLRVVVDPARQMLERARIHDIAGLQADGARLPVQPNSVDAIVVRDALHHMGDQDAVIEEAARVLRPGGVLVVLEFDPSTIRGRLLAATEHLVRFDSVFMTVAELTTMLETAGFEATTLKRGFQYAVGGVVPTGDAGSSKSLRSD